MALIFLLQGIVVVGFVAEAGIGFGATVIVVTLAGLLVPLSTILPAFVPVNLMLSAWLVARNRGALRLGLVATELGPSVALGLAVGLWAFRRQRLDVLALGFAAFVVALSALELWRARGPAPPMAPLGPWVRRILLALGGAVHGLFGTGGPMIVYVLQRRGLDKASFRATLALVWLALNGALLLGYAQQGLVSAGSLRLSAALAAALPPSLWLGERLHRRLSARRFTLGIFVLLGAAGLALGVKSALQLVHGA